MTYICMYMYIHLYTQMHIYWDLHFKAIKMKQCCITVWLSVSCLSDSALMLEIHACCQCSNSSFPFTATEYHVVWICHNLSIHSVVDMAVSDGFTNTSRIAISSLIQRSQCTQASMPLGYMPESELSGSVHEMQTLCQVPQACAKMLVAPHPRHLLIQTV